MFGLYLLTSGIAGGVVFCFALFARETLIEYGDGFKRIDSGWSVLERRAYKKWRYETKSSLLLTSGQRTWVSLGVLSALTLSSGYFGINIAVSGLGALLGLLATVGIGTISGVALALGLIAYLRNADPSARGEWEKSDAYKAYWEDYQQNPEAHQDAEFEAQMDEELARGAVTKEEAEEMRERWYEGRGEE